MIGREINVEDVSERQDCPQRAQRRRRLAILAAALAVVLGLCAPSAQAQSPTLLIFHPGGFIWGDTEQMYRAVTIANEMGFNVDNVDYPLWDLKGAVASAEQAAAQYEDVYAYGESSGGTLAALLAQRGLVKAAAAYSPVANLRVFARHLSPDPPYAALVNATNADLRRASPIYFDSPLPILALTPRDDSRWMNQKTRKWAAADPEVEALTVPGDHLGDPNDPSVYDANARLLMRFLSPVDDPPAAVHDRATVAEDSGANTLDVLANDLDIDGGPKQIVSATNGAHGGVAITNGGADLTYSPDPDFAGSDRFTYTLNGGAAATISITVTPVDDLPPAVDDQATVAEDSGANTIDVLANDLDIDGGPKQIESNTNGAHGSVAITNDGADLTYTPDPDYSGSDSFTYTLNGGSTATVAVTVTPVDDPPSAVGDQATVAMDSGASTIDVLANDLDADGGPKQIESNTNGAHGSVAITNDGADLTYTPDPDYSGSDSFTYTLNGGSTATVAVTVTPEPSRHPYPALERRKTSGPRRRRRTEADRVEHERAHGSVAITNGGADLTYTPDPDFVGPDSFTYTLNGGSTATVAVTVTP